MSIVADDLCKRFDGELAVDHLTFRVPAGEIYGLIGPNGAGKTTTQRMLVGLMRPSAGAASICGEDVVRAPLAAKAHVGFLTGSTGLYARLTAAEVLRYFGALHGMPRGAIRERTRELAEQLQFAHLLDRRCDGLSSGERQRVSLARAAIHDPPVLILDEPTASLDVLASRFVAEFIRAARDRGRAILFSTHYMTEAELLCDRVGLLYRGRLLCEGPPADLRTRSGSLEQAFLELVRAQEQPVAPRASDGRTVPDALR